MASTPRADADAEIVATLAAGTLTAPDALYARVVDDLGAIRAHDPSLETVHARWPFGTGIYVSFDEAGTAEYQAGTYDDWDCVNARHEGVPRESGLEDTAYIDFGDDRLNQSRLTSVYTDLAHVIVVEADLAIGDGSTICLQPGETDNRYLFAEGGGDCPAGCTEWRYWVYRVDASGAVSLEDEPAELPEEWAAVCYA